MSTPDLDVLYIDNHLLVVNKPAPLPTQGADEGDESLVEAARAFLKREFDKPGNVYVGVVSRLDAFVTGVVVLARTSKAADRLTKQFAAGSVTKRYRALLAAPPSPIEAECEDWLVKDDGARRMVVVDEDTAGARHATLRYALVGTASSHSVVDIELITGRKHQIRAQLAARGYPIVGDRKYGSRQKFPRGIALHAVELQIDHPVSKERLTIRSTPPSYWPATKLN